MADISDNNSALNVRVTGADSTGAEQTPVGSTTEGRLKVDAKVSGTDGQTDTSGRIRVVNPVELLSYYFANSDHPLKFNTTLTAGSTGTVALTLNKGSVTISNSTANLHKINFSTKKYIRYTPGQTHKCTVAARIGTAKTNVEKRWGMFTEFNGYFFKQTASTLSVCVRDGGAGDPVVETTVNQANWNIDKLDGTGKSGFTLNPDFHGIYVIEFDWHGAGSVKYGIKYRGQTIYCHVVEFDFVQTDTSIRSPQLPVNVEIKNVGAVTGTTEILLAATSVYKDGNSEVRPTYSFSASRGVSAKTVTNAAAIPLIAIRPKLNFKGILARTGLVPTSIEIITDTNDLYVQLVLNPTTITGAAFNSVNAESNAEFDIAATAITGGIVVWEGYVSPNQANVTALINSDSVRDILELGVSYTLSVADVLVVTAQSTGNNNRTFAAIQWLEYQ